MSGSLLFSKCQLSILRQTEQFAQNFMKYYDWSHDYNHVLRVKTIATKIALAESLDKNDIFEIQLGALLHDINDEKYKTSHLTQNEIIRKFYADKNIPSHIIENVVMIACNTSLSKQLQFDDIKCIKVDCVRDADRIESLGAIGIARYFKYGITKQDRKLEDIIENIKTRTAILSQRVKTNTGKKIMQNKLTLINSFIEDYYDSVKN
jgi:uncharacterized protein